jgi:hypothetical protein
MNIYNVNIPGRPGNSPTSAIQTMRATAKISVMEGMEMKEGPAYIMTVGYNSSTSELMGNVTYLSDKFFLQVLNEVHQERAQIIETFSSPTILFFGERIKVYNMVGTFLDAKMGQNEIDYNWAAAFRLFYEDHLRGTQLAEHNQIAILVANDHAYWGYPTSLNISMDSRNPYLATFNMSWIVIKQDFLPPTGQSGADNKEFFKQLRSLFGTTRSAMTAAQREQLKQLYLTREAQEKNLAKYEADLKKAQDTKDPVATSSAQGLVGEERLRLVENQSAINNLLGL